MLITINSVRDKLRDTVDQNTYLDAEEFTDELISNAIDQSLSYWNSSTPLVDELKYATIVDVAEYSEQFLNGIVGILLTDHVLLYSRNKDSSTEDPAMAQTISEYKQIGDQYLTRFLQWIGMTKHALAAKGIITANPSYDIPVITLTQETVENNDFTIYDYSGNEITLDPYTVTLYVKEYDSASSCILSKDLTKSDSTTALLTTDGDDFEHAGLYTGEFVLIESSDIKYRYPVYVNVEPALYSSNSKQVLTVRRLRRVLKDRINENYIIGEQEFTDADLAKAVRDAVNYWNSAPPRISKYTYTTVTFPEEFIGAWEEASTGYALRRASMKLMRNMVNPMEADVQNISQQMDMYRKLGEQKVQMYQKWVQNTKIHLNLSSAWGGRKLQSFG